MIGIVKHAEVLIMLSLSPVISAIRTGLYLIVGLLPGSGSIWYMEAGAGGDEGGMKRSVLLPLSRRQMFKGLSLWWQGSCHSSSSPGILEPGLQPLMM